MEAWVVFAVVAALAQTVRFAIQKRLADGQFSPGGATFARFVWSAPFAALLAWLYSQASGLTLGAPGVEFYLWGAVGGAAQILATITTVSLFKLRAFAVGITFKKTEVMLTALVGFVLLGDTIGFAGIMAIAAGSIGVLLLSEPPGGGRRVNRAAALGLLSGLFFAVSAVAYRAATLALPGGDAILTGGATLAAVTLFQTVVLGLWLRLAEPGQIGAVLRGWRVTGVVGAFSLIGSWGWFAAFSLKNAAFVFAVGQVELIFSVLVGWFWFRERLGVRETAGILLLTLSITAVAMLG